MPNSSHDWIRFAGVLLPVLLGCIWTITAIYRGKRKVVYAAVAGAIGGAIICVAGMAVDMPPVMLLVFGAFWGAVGGAIVGVFLGLPAGLVYVYIRRNQRVPENVEKGPAKRRQHSAFGPTGGSITLIIGFAACSVWLLAVIPDTWSPLPSLPDVLSVKSATDSRHPHKAFFEVPRACWADIYSSLLPWGEAGELLDWTEIGSLRIETKRGTIFDVDVWNPSDGIPVYEVTSGNEHYWCRGGNTRRIKDALAKASSKSQTGDKSPETREERR